MDTRYSDEQVALRETVIRLADRLGPATVPDLDDEDRRARLTAAVAETGWWWLRDAAGDATEGRGAPLASGTDVSVVAEALGRGLVDAPLLGPVLAGDLLRRVGVATGDDRPTIGLRCDLEALAVGSSNPIVAIDADGATDALVLVDAAGGWRVASVGLASVAQGSDLTRRTAAVPAGAAWQEIDGQQRMLDGDDIAAWTALGLAATSADLVGVMRGALAMAVDYVVQREQYGRAVGSFQAVQHLLADAKVLLEGSISCTLHAAWAVDALAPAEALQAGRVAKAYCSRAARTVCETVIQVHGGMGNTWECLAHVYLRRALQSTDVLGGDGVHLHALAAERTGYGVGLR